MPEPLTLTPPEAESKRPRAARLDGRSGGFQQGSWPKDPPFTVSRRSTQHYFLVGHVSSPAYQRLVNATEDRVFPWTEYIARRWGPGVYMVESDKNPKPGLPGPRSFFTVPESLSYLFTVEQVGAQPAPAASAPPPPVVDVDPTDDDADEVDPLERFEAELERVDRIKARLGLQNPPPPPPPKPTLMDVLSNPAVVPHVLQTLQRMMGGGAAPNPPPPTPPSPWEILGRHYESLGVSAEDMLAELERNLAAQAAAQQAQQADAHRAAAPADDSDE